MAAKRLGWGWVGVALSATVVGISIYVLSRLLADLDFDRVLGLARAMPRQSIALAIGFIGCAYAMLTCYDLFALRTIGAYHVPYRIAAMASFTSYAIGHNIGATAFSGGAIRYRIYQTFGLSVIDVARICFLTGLTFWLGNFTVLGIGMAYLPDAPALILRLSPATIRVVGVAALVMLVGYLVWASTARRSFGRDNWRVDLPGGTSTLIQIGIGLGDLGSSALAMYCLLPAAAHEGFFKVAVAFVSATLLGFASHAPGSIGVFDAALLLALPEVGREELVAALLMFRMLYFMVPFVLALLTMAAWETSTFLRRGRGRPQPSGGKPDS